MKIIELFESQFLQVPQDYESELGDASEIADYMQSLATEELDPEYLWEFFRNCKATLQHLPITSLKEGHEDNNIADSKKEKRYMKMDPKFMPPIIVENGEVIDGNHRFRVTKAKGMKEIWAYVITPNRELSEALESSQYPKKLPNAEAIADYILAVGDPNSLPHKDEIESMFSDCSAILRLLPINSIRFYGNKEDGFADTKMVSNYSKLDPSTTPPIIVRDGIIEDGNHRFTVAKQKGLTHIWAYVIKFIGEPF